MYKAPKSEASEISFMLIKIQKSTKFFLELHVLQWDRLFPENVI